MKYLLKSLGLSVFLFSGISYAQQAPFSVEIGYGINQFTGQRYPTVTVISDDDRITINNIVVNRGNCSVFAKDLGGIQRTLSFGDQVTYRSNNCSSFREIVIESSKGRWTFTPR